MVTERNTLPARSLEQRVSNMEMLLKLFGALSGLSIVGVLAFAFWLGSLSATVSTSSQTVTRVYGAVAENKDSLLVRTGVIEHRLDNIEKRLDNIESRIASVESKLDKLIALQGQR